MNTPLHTDRTRVLYAILAALLVWLMFNGVSKGLGAVETGEVVLIEGNEHGR